MSWSRVMMLCDVLLGSVWRCADVLDWWAVTRQIEQELGLAEDRLCITGDREGPLLLLAWLLNAWNRGSAVALVEGAIRRWVGGEAERASWNLGPTLAEAHELRLPELLEKIAA